MPITQDRMIAIISTAKHLAQSLENLRKAAATARLHAREEDAAGWALIAQIEAVQPEPKQLANIFQEDAHFKARYKKNVSRKFWQQRKDQTLSGQRRPFTQEELSAREKSRDLAKIPPEVREIMEGARRARKGPEAHHQDGRTTEQILADQEDQLAFEQEELAAFNSGNIF